MCFCAHSDVFFYQTTPSRTFRTFIISIRLQQTIRYTNIKNFYNFSDPISSSKIVRPFLLLPFQLIVNIFINFKTAITSRLLKFRTVYWTDNLYQIQENKLYYSDHFFCTPTQGIANGRSPALPKLQIMTVEISSFS